jgi:hypothetical protein
MSAPSIHRQITCKRFRSVSEAISHCEFIGEFEPGLPVDFSDVAMEVFGPTLSDRQLREAPLWQISR